MTAPLVEYGPRAALHWTEIEEITARARRIMAEHPRNANTFGGSGRQQALYVLAVGYSITLRTLYRYLQAGPPIAVRCGPWTAYFVDHYGGDWPPVQVGGWVHDDEDDEAPT